MRHWRIPALTFAITFFGIGCSGSNGPNDPNGQADTGAGIAEVKPGTTQFAEPASLEHFLGDAARVTLEAIRERGVLSVGMRVKRGVFEPPAAGFHYRIVSHLAELAGVYASITIVENISSYFVRTTNFGGKRLPIDVDLYADIITILPDREEVVRFIPLIPVRQIIIHRRGADFHSLSELENAGIAMVRGSSYEAEMQSIAEEIGIETRMYYVATTADMVPAIAEGAADATLQDSVLGFDILREHPQLVLGRPVGKMQMLGWAVAKNDPGAADLIASYIRYIRETGFWEGLWRESFGIGYLDYLTLIGI